MHIHIAIISVFIYFAIQLLVICKSGHYGEERNGTWYCIPCPRNEYQPQEEQFRCLHCPKSHVTKSEGATDLNQCIFGKKLNAYKHFIVHTLLTDPKCKKVP